MIPPNRKPTAVRQPPRNSTKQPPAQTVGRFDADGATESMTANADRKFDRQIQVSLLRYVLTSLPQFPVLFVASSDERILAKGEQNAEITSIAQTIGFLRLPIENGRLTGGTTMRIIAPVTVVSIAVITLIKAIKIGFIMANCRGLLRQTRLEILATKATEPQNAFRAKLVQFLKESPENVPTKTLSRSQRR